MIESILITLAPEKPYDVVRFDRDEDGHITHTIEGVYRVFEVEVSLTPESVVVDVLANRVRPHDVLSLVTTRLCSEDMGYNQLHEHFNLDEVIRKARILMGEAEAEK